MRQPLALRHSPRTQTHLERGVFTCANKEPGVRRPCEPVDSANVPSKSRYELARPAFPQSYAVVPRSTCCPSAIGTESNVRHLTLVSSQAGHGFEFSPV
jgi:hypothetical protein